ncbi:DUF58 domain-containing protein [Acidipropionibacterium jensenii]|uniref:DUF58 domain-containing protein n=1 Tax=Acidipropionibacterium jensenii TaxID=1749 RepID=UPI00214C66CA
MRLWRHLTLRGRVLLVCGVVLTVVALGFGEHDMAWVGLLLVLIPVLGLVLVTATGLRMSCTRTVRPSRCTLGDRMQVSTTLERTGGLPIGILRFEETVPRALGLRPRFAVHSLSGRWRRTVDYTLDGRARGRYRIGPMLVRACDPFGTAVSDHQFSTATDVMVTPRSWPLAGFNRASGAGQSGETTPQQIGSQGQDDILIREYRHGDDLSRVHWRSTAHQGELMVRREEQAWDPAITVLLDSRADRHAGLGPASSFEWAVSAAASVCSHMLHSGYRVRMADATGITMNSLDVDSTVALERSIQTLTDQRMGDQQDLTDAARACSSSQGGETVVAILGRLTDADVLALDATRIGRPQSLALVLDTDSFTARRFRGTPEQADQHDRAVEHLHAHGWHVVTVRGGDSVPSAWQRFDRIEVLR